MGNKIIRQDKDQQKGCRAEKQDGRIIKRASQKNSQTSKAKRQATSSRAARPANRIAGRSNRTAEPGN